jgi:hypothetical protein
MGSGISSIHRPQNVRRRARRLFMAAVASFALVTPTAALASGSDTVWSGYLYLFQGYHSEAPRHSLTSVTAYSGSRSDGNQVACVNAWNDEGGWAGADHCGWPSTDHPYCGSCHLRIGYAHENSNVQVVHDYDWVNAIWQQFW